MAKKPSTRKKLKKPIVGKSTARKPRSRAVADPKTQRPKTKKHRVDGVVAALDDVLHGIGAERADRIRQRVRAILTSFR